MGGIISASAIMSSGDGLQQVSKIVNSFFNKPETLAFREPVNPKAMGIPDYPQIVKNPMDLGTVRDGHTGSSRDDRYFCRTTPDKRNA